MYIILAEGKQNKMWEFNLFGEFSFYTVMISVNGNFGSTACHKFLPSTKKANITNALFPHLSLFSAAWELEKLENCNYQMFELLFGESKVVRTRFHHYWL